MADIRMRRIEDAPHLMALERFMRNRYGMSGQEYKAWSKTLTALKAKHKELLIEKVTETAIPVTPDANYPSDKEQVTNYDKRNA